MKYCVDIDGTLLYSKFDGREYNIVDKNEKLISILNRLYNEGHMVVLHTGRHWDRLDITIEHLREAGVLYTTLVMGKPAADFYIDDRGISPDVFTQMMRGHN